MDFIEIEIVKWEQYNPRTDRKKHSWFRLENSIATEPKFFGLSAAQKFIAICLFAEVSKHSGAATKINVAWLADQLKIKPKEILETVQRLVTEGVVRLPSGTHSGLPAVTDGHTTYDTYDTYERTIRTNNNAHAEAFALFWAAYPRKVGKGKAESAYRKLIAAGTGPDLISKGLGNYLAFLRREQTDAKFILHGPTFLNQVKDWLDPEHGKSEGFAAAQGIDWSKFKEPEGAA